MNWTIILFCALPFFFLQNQYFGWNSWPKSDAELMADGITILLIAMACR